MAFKPSPFQEKIFEFIRTGKGSAIVEAVAGSGKTTTIVQGMKLIPQDKDVLFLAFNKSIAEELKKKVPSHVDVKTLNALGHGGWMRWLRNATGAKVQLDSNKTRELMNGSFFKQQFPREVIRQNFGNVLKLTALAKMNGMVPAHVFESDQAIKPLMTASVENFDQVIHHHNLEFEHEIDRLQTLRMTTLLLELSIQQKEVIDFNDQLYMSAIFEAPMKKYDWVFIDEAQDVTEINIKLAEMSLKKSGSLVAVGDPCQAIYGFRGADSESLNKIKKAFDCQTLPLSITYRCPKKVVQEAQRYVNHIEAFDGADQGIVEHVGCYMGKENLFQNGDMVLCRCVAPLIKLAYYLVSRKQPVIIFGKDIAKTFIDLITKLEVESIDELMIELSLWANREIEKATRRDPNADISTIVDKKDAIMTFIDCTDVTTVAGLIVEIENLFGNIEENSVILSSIHKSKGLEAYRVFILDFHLMPIKYAMKRPWMLEQEKNLQYVAITRSKNSLYYVESPPREE